MSDISNDLADTALSPDSMLGLPAAFRDTVVSSLRKTTDEKALRTFASLMRSVEVGADFLNTIRRELVYIARIPKHLEGGVMSGALKFMKRTNTGESIGVIVDTDNVSHGFVRIEQGTIPNPNLIHSLSNLAMQQQLAHMAETLDDIRSKVTILKEMHDSALYGKLRGMRDLLTQIMDAQNADTKKQLATNAITVLNETRGEITQRLVDEMKRLLESPAERFYVDMRVFFDKGFKTSVVDGYDKIQELFHHYLTATQLLAYAYAFLDEPTSFDVVFMPDLDLTNGHCLKKLVLAEMLVGCIEGAWYKEPELFIGRIRQEAQKMMDDTSDAFVIEVTGRQLLEAMSNDEEE